MTLKETLSDHIKNAMLQKDALRLGTLRMIKAKLLEKEVEKRTSPDKVGVTAEDEMQVLISSAKMRKESIEEFEKAGRKDLADKERAELEIIQEYLPKQMSRGEVEKIVNELAVSLGAQTQKDFGKLMGAVMKELRGKVDGKIVQEVVKAKLG
ncbi:MAG: GatB/YqeY domain-containing protein [Bacteroidetes bacterium]|nr:GatB/YqeY domain-containing protein [Bacteroidota bacterium]MCL5737367.1 GatB/YqeY domain-containing protein [Bacteroidota bacterium]